MTTKKELKKEILENLDILGKKVKISDKVNGKAGAYDAYKKTKELLR